MAANKTITASNGAGSGTNSGAAGDNAGSGINSGAGGGSAGQGSGNGTGSGGTTLTSERSSVTRTIGETPGGIQPFQVDANFSWTGATNTTWSVPTNWTRGGTANADTALFNRRIQQSAQRHRSNCRGRRTAHGDRCRSKRHALLQRRPDPHNRGLRRYRHSNR